MFMCCVWVDVKHKLYYVYVMLCFVILLILFIVMLRYAFYSFTVRYVMLC